MNVAVVHDIRDIERSAMKSINPFPLIMMLIIILFIVYYLYGIR